MPSLLSTLSPVVMRQNAEEYDMMIQWVLTSIIAGEQAMETVLELDYS